jgi:hypothetical protein
VLAYTRRSHHQAAWFHFDDSDHWIFHSPEAAQAHLVTASAHRLWTLIPEAGGQTPRQLARTLAEALGCAADDQFINSVRDTLTLFDDAGLVGVVDVPDQQP